MGIEPIAIALINDTHPVSVSQPVGRSTEYGWDGAVRIRGRGRWCHRNGKPSQHGRLGVWWAYVWRKNYKRGEEKNQFAPRWLCLVITTGHLGLFRCFKLLLALCEALE